MSTDELRKLSDIRLSGMDTGEAIAEIEKYLNSLRRYLLDRSVILPKEQVPSEGQPGHLVFDGQYLWFGTKDPTTGEVSYHIVGGGTI
jgi:hypothetical protein